MATLGKKKRFMDESSDNDSEDLFPATQNQLELRRKMAKKQTTEIEGLSKKCEFISTLIDSGFIFDETRDLEEPHTLNCEQVCNFLVEIFLLKVRQY